jgi:hypothetical protein
VGAHDRDDRGCRVIAAAAKAASPTLFANSPTVSSDQEKHFMPTVGSSR